MTTIPKEVLADLEYWRQFERGAWKVHGFTERDSAEFYNLETGRSVTVTGDYLDLLVHTKRRE